MSRSISGEARGTISTTVMYAPTCGALNRDGRPESSVIEYLRHPRVKRDNPLPHQGGDHDQPHRRRLERVCHACRD
jgi:hypothetical protein